MDESQKNLGQRKRKHYTRQERLNYCEAWKVSGLTQTQFCKANELAIQTFSRWIKELKDLSKSKRAFLPVEVIAEKKINLHSQNDLLKLELQLNQGIICRFTGILLADICRLIKVLHHDSVVL